MTSLFGYTILVFTMMPFFGYSISTNDSCGEQDWFPSGLTKCLGVSTARDLDTWSWTKAAELCPQWRPLSSIASLPLDSDGTSLYGRLVDQMSYWIGLTSYPPHSDRLVWMNGASTNRSQFHVNGDTSSRLCGHVTLRTHNLSISMGWTLGDCDLHLPYICSFDKDGTSQTGSLVHAAGTARLTPAHKTANNTTAATAANKTASTTATNKTASATAANRKASATAANNTASARAANKATAADKTASATAANNAASATAEYMTAANKTASARAANKATAADKTASATAANMTAANKATAADMTAANKTVEARASYKTVVNKTAPSTAANRTIKTTKAKKVTVKTVQSTDRAAAMRKVTHSTAVNSNNTRKRKSIFKKESNFVHDYLKVVRSDQSDGSKTDHNNMSETDHSSASETDHNVTEKDHNASETDHNNVSGTDQYNVSRADHVIVSETDHYIVSETDHANVSETDNVNVSEINHIRKPEMNVLDFPKTILEKLKEKYKEEYKEKYEEKYKEKYKESYRSVAKIRRPRDTNLPGSRGLSLNKLHDYEHPSNDCDHQGCGGHNGGNSSKAATYVTVASHALVARGDISPSSVQGPTSGSPMSTSAPLTPDAGTNSTPTAASTSSDKASPPSSVNTAAPATTLSAAVIQARAPYSAQPFSSSHIDTIRTILKCNTSDLAECLTSVVTLTTSIDLTYDEEQSLMTSFDFLLDELVNVGMTRDTVNIYVDLREFAQILNVNIHLCGLVDSRCNERRLNTLLAKAEDFLELVMTSNLSSQLKGRSSFSFNHLDLVMVKTAYGSIRGRTLHMKSGEITIDDIAPKSGFSSSAKTFVTAMIMHLPRSTVSLVRDSTDQVSAAVVSPVLSLKAYVEWSRVSISHTFILPATSLENDTDVPICGFQRNGYNGSQDLWDTIGCSVVDIDRNMFEALSKPFTDFLESQPTNATQERQPRFVGCSCNHTTNFAILMQVVDFKVSDSDDLALSIITYIGCSVTLITQVIAITVFTCIRSLNSERVCVHRNLCITIMAAQVTFISGVKAVEDKVLCAVVAVALHYLYSATFVWMLVEGLHLYNKVVRVFGTEKSRIIYYIFFGWGVPLILVAISAAVDWEGYGNSRSCWLSIQRRTIWAFVGPAAAIIIVNLVILMLVLRIVVTSATVDKQDNHAQIKAGVKASLFLAPLLGLTWTFGLASVNVDLLAFQYVFAVLNSLQGFFIFLFHCALNTEVRQALKRLRERRSLQKGDFGSSSTSSGSRPSSSDTRSSHVHQITVRERFSPLSKKINQVEPVVDCKNTMKDALDGEEFGKVQIKSGILGLI